MALHLGLNSVCVKQTVVREATKEDLIQTQEEVIFRNAGDVCREDPSLEDEHL